MDVPERERAPAAAQGDAVGKLPGELCEVCAAAVRGGLGGCGALP